MQIRVKKNALIYFFVALVIACIVGNRGATRDTAVYYDVFKSVQKLDLLNPVKFYIVTGMEIGFGWYSLVISLFTGSRFLLFAIFSFLTLYVVYKTSEKVSAQFMLVALLYLSSGYFLLQQFMQIRQGLATPLALYAIAVFIEKNNRFSLQFVLLSLLAVSFHQVALPVIAVGVTAAFLLAKKELSVSKFRILCLVALVLFVFISKALLINLLISFSSRVETYSRSVEYASEVGLFRLPNIKAFLTFLLIFSVLNQRIYQNRLFVVFFVLFTLGLAFRIGFADFAILSGRFATAFSFSEIYMLPFIFCRFKYGKIFLLLFAVMQAVATYVYQAPFVFEDYFKPIQ
ncbi:EpsG family protein [Capnocytophaga sp.]|uniref:EpsG family protein n=1 Tax=Capnocytophaga sp. TaxID=44737 RepID=UPI0026DDB2BB|nr:EpsG family protein [Capnocytophaga sp.]MDO5104287.1 EpsG family protein [Capnocytophaga sp.]